MEYRLQKKYKEIVAPAIMKQFKLTNVMEVPRITKVSINAGVGAFRDNKEAFETFTSELSEIAGQKIFLRKAKASEAGFKMKKGDNVGVAVTLRNGKMWSFLDKFISIVLPRVRDFRGLGTTSFDESGNYSVGIREHTIFPEVNANTTKGIRSIQVTVCFEGGSPEVDLALLRELGFPFKKGDK